MTNRTTDTATAISGCLMIIAFGVFISIIGVLVTGWIFSMAWNGFVVPVFELPSIDIIQGIFAMVGVYVTSLMINRPTIPTSRSKKDD